MMFSRCQYEFKKDYMEDLDKQKYEDDLSKAESDDEKKNITAEFEAQEMKLRRRSLGNIRFIGKIRDLDIEGFKLKIGYYLLLLKCLFHNHEYLLPCNYFLNWYQKLVCCLILTRTPIYV